MVSKKNKLIVLVPSKTGSHSISKYLQSLNFNFDPILLNQNNNLPKLHLTLKEHCLYFNIGPDDLKDYNIIQITRNPIDRIISAYNHQQILLGHKFEFSLFLHLLETNLYLLPENYDQFYDNFYNGLNFKNWKQKCYSEGHWGGLRFYYPQHIWNNLNAKIHYFKLEDLNINNKLNKIFNSNIPFPKEYSSNKPKLLLSSSNQTKIYNLYKNDFIKFKYDFNIT